MNIYDENDLPPVCRAIKCSVSYCDIHNEQVCVCTGCWQSQERYQTAEKVRLKSSLLMKNTLCTCPLSLYTSPITVTFRRFGCFLFTIMDCITPYIHFATPDSCSIASVLLRNSLWHVKRKIQQLSQTTALSLTLHWTWSHEHNTVRWKAKRAACSPWQVTIGRVPFHYWWRQHILNLNVDTCGGSPSTCFVTYSNKRHRAKHTHTNTER